ncbi:zinc finger CW-type PWWP domain protein 1 isoform X2 [Rhineura floridana]|uniref:zinc finger CW-type PWWP domain protein 1 isoform X2 n=1 Tax=Rhineura floridana TaxID=261503 RepID=UPI002AC80ECF|nr:zinc finger CW-type PWWP domain protein 1 isoform X2 [Rhineura floridana]
MTSQNNKGELRKVSKRKFSPPVATPHTLFAKGELLELQGKQEDAETKGIPVALHHATGDGVTTKPIKTPKTQATRQKGSTTARMVKEANCKKDPDTRKGTTERVSGESSQGKHSKVLTPQEEGCLTDAEFEEIVQSVLQKPLQECMDSEKQRTTSTEPTDSEAGLRRGALEVSPAAEDDVFGKKSEMMLLEVDEKRQLHEKEHRKLYVNKDRKKKNEKSEGDNGGRKENRKGAPKKKVQGNAHVLLDQEEMQEEEANGGSSCSWCMAWVQCSYPTCEKWRQLSSDIDPSVLPEYWTCSQNPDLQYNSCNIPEETWSGSENEVVYAVYIPGSIVWAKQYGYPWWPGIIEADPDIGEYFLFSSPTDSLPSKYHVTFFGSCVTRAWISVSMLRNFGEHDVEGNGVAKLKSKGDKKNFEAALKMANEAEQINIQERIRIFGFHSRFGGTESPEDHKDHKDHVAVTCKPPAKRIQKPSGGNKNTATSNKSQEKLLPETSGMKLDEDFKRETSIKGRKTSKLSAEGTPPLSKKSRKESAPPKAPAVPKGSSKARKYQDDPKGFRNSFAVAQDKNPKAAQLSSCTGSSSTNLVPASYQRKKDSMSTAENSPMEGGKPILNRGVVVGLEEANEAMALEKEEEEAFSSQEMVVFAEEKNYSSEDFSLTLFEE